jgi:fructokinase
MARLYGGLEAGGTKITCAVGTGPEDLRAQVRFATATPDETLRQVIGFFRQQEDQFGPLAALGIASFGPLGLQPTSPAYGYITSTPKPGWANTDIVGLLQQELNLPIGLDTDVNAAALGEWRWGAAQGLDTFVYLTLGTGIGGGGMANHQRLHGLLHPEMGHIPLPHDTVADPFPGVCPFHGDCFEGLASGPAIERRWSNRAESLPPDHPAWELEVHYLALALTTYIYTLSPQRIILGGGVMTQHHIFPRVRLRVQERLNGYIRASAVLEGIHSYIVPPALGAQTGVLGAIALAIEVEASQVDHDNVATHRA